MTDVEIQEAQRIIQHEKHMEALAEKVMRNPLAHLSSDLRPILRDGDELAVQRFMNALDRLDKHDVAEYIVWLLRN